MLQFTYGSSPHTIEITVLKCGADLIVIAGGGERPHTGAVAVAYSHPSIKDPTKLTSTVSVITIPGHKEDEIARSAALKLSKALKCVVTVSVGLHLDNASIEDIKLLVNNYHASIDRIEEKISDKK